MDNLSQWIYISTVLASICPLFVCPFLMSPSDSGQALPDECSYFATFIDAVETIKTMMSNKEYLHVQLGSNFAKSLLSLPLDTDETMYNNAKTGPSASGLVTLKEDLSLIHYYRHDTCLQLIINDLASYLQTNKYGVCTQYKNLMSSSINTDNINCLQPATCTQCLNGTDCVNASTPVACSNGERFCMTATIQTKTGRQVTRKCADEPDCRTDIIGVPQCKLVNIGTGIEYDCTFCCTSYNCNKGPQVIPGIIT